jgi:hypothetical protein
MRCGVVEETERVCFERESERHRRGRAARTHTRNTPYLKSRSRQRHVVIARNSVHVSSGWMKEWAALISESALLNVVGAHKKKTNK